jgi:hypothetical protein
VSRVETGRVGLRGRDLNDLLELYRVNDSALSEELASLAREGKQRGWWSKYADSLLSPYATYIGFESEADEVLVHETLVVTGLLQTEEYARAVIGSAMFPANSGDTTERRVQVRMERQELLAKPRSLKLWAILDESVLHRQVGGPSVQRGQLKHLGQMAILPNVTIQVLPFDAGVFLGMVGSFSVVRFPSRDDPDIVYIEGITGDLFAESEDARTYLNVYDHLRASALGPTESIMRIERVCDELA